MRRTDGFTLVELLVSLLIVGILAAIAIPSFMGQRMRASDSEAKAHLVSAHKALESYKLDNGGSYAGATPAGLVAIEPTLAGASGLSIPTAGASSFILQVDSTATNGGGGPFYLGREAGGRTYRACARPDTGGCGPARPVPGFGSPGSW